MLIICLRKCANSSRWLLYIPRHEPQVKPTFTVFAADAAHCRATRIPKETLNCEARKFYMHPLTAAHLDLSADVPDQPWLGKLRQS